MDESKRIKSFPQTLAYTGANKPSSDGGQKSLQTMGTQLKGRFKRPALSEKRGGGDYGANQESAAEDGTGSQAEGGASRPGGGRLVEQRPGQGASSRSELSFRANDQLEQLPASAQFNDAAFEQAQSRGRPPRLDSLMAPLSRQRARSEVPTATPPMPQALMLGKTDLRLPTEWYQAQGITERRKIVCSENHIYVKGRSKANGTSGKFAYATLVAGGVPRSVAIKEMRQYAKVGLTWDGRRKTDPMSSAQVQEEFAKAKTVVELFGRYIAQYESCFLPQANVLDGFRAAQRRAPIFDYIYDERNQKSFIVSDLGLSDMNALIEPAQPSRSQSLPADIRPAFVLSAMVQLSLQLAITNSHARLAHLDLKPANVIVFADGSMQLADFGLAHPLSVDGFTPVRGYSSSLLAPEQLSLSARPEDGLMTAATDAHALAATLATALLAGVNVQNIFYPPNGLVEYIPVYNQQGATRLEKRWGKGFNEAARRMIALDQLIHALPRSAAGQLVLPRNWRGKFQPERMPASGHPTVDRFVREMAQRSLKITEILLPYFVATPSERPPVTEMARQGGEELTKYGAADKEKLAAYLANRSENIAQREASEQDRRFAAAAGIA